MRVARRRDVPGDVEQVEALWYDYGRWGEWVDGLREVDQVTADWPAQGGSLVWRSGPYGRGEVRERVADHTPGSGQLVEWEDDEMQGTQEVAFVPDDEKGHVRILLTTEYKVKRRGPLLAIVNLIFVRSQMGQMMSRTLNNFAGILDEG
jgi:hypothetical protein